jgi:hypothetical protein
MDLPNPNEMDQYIMDGTGPSGDAEAVVWRVGEDDQEDVNTAIYDEFSRSFSFAASGLQGCTMLAVISRKGVYMSHWWENISFDPDKDQLGEYDGGDRLETKEEIFQRLVIDGLNKGVKGDDKEELQVSFKQFARGRADDFVRAYLIRPAKSYQNTEDEDEGKDIGPPEKHGYPEQWQKIKETVVKIIPKLGESGRWSEVIYDATDDKDILDTTPRGRVLFKFDPQHVKKVGRTGKDTRLAMLWVETREIHRDQWQD